MVKGVVWGSPHRGHLAAFSERLLLQALQLVNDMIFLFDGIPRICLSNSSVQHIVFLISITNTGHYRCASTRIKYQTQLNT